MNRYDVASVAKFSPLSFNELAAAPTMMRQKHDASIAAAEALRIQANPLDKHLSRALEIKNQMDAEIAKNVDTLNKEGYNPTTFQNITKLNRQYQDLISPTGEIGKINAAKQQYLAEQKAFLDNAEKNGISRTAALNRWNEHDSKYTGFDTDNKTILNIGSLGAPNKKDLHESISKLHSLLGSKEYSKAMSGYKLIIGDGSNGLPIGSTAWRTANGSLTTKTNIPQIDEAMQALAADWFNPNGEGYKYAKFNDMDFNNLADQVQHSFNAMKETSYKDDRGYNYNYDKPDENSKYSSDTGEEYNLDTIPMGNHKAMLDALNNQDTNTYSPGHSTYNDAAVPKKGASSPQSKMIATPEYQQLARSIVRNNTALKGLKYNDPRVIDGVKNYLENNQDYALENAFVSPNKSQDSSLFESASDRKTDEDRNSTLKTRIMSGSAQMYDRETGKALDKDTLESMKDLTYLGYGTAKSQFKMEGANGNQKIMPILATYTDKDGTNKQILVTRNSNDFNKPFFKAAKMYRGLSKIADPFPDLYHPLVSPELEAMGLKNAEIKRDKETGAYKINAEIKGKNGEYKKQPLYFENGEELQKWLYDAYNPNKKE